MTTLNVLGVSGSLRKGSTNTRLLEYAQEFAPDNMTITIADIGTMPLYNQDLVSDDLVYPASVETWRQAVRTADAVLFAVPEYNYSVTPALKNAFDWASRPGADGPPPASIPLFAKPGAIIGSGGRYGTARAQLHFRQIASAMGMHLVTKPDVLIKLPMGAFDQNNNLVDENALNLLRQLVTELDAWTRFIQSRNQA